MSKLRSPGCGTSNAASFSVRFCMSERRGLPRREVAKGRPTREPSPCGDVILVVLA